MYDLCEVKTAGELIVDKFTSDHRLELPRSKPALAGTIAIPIDVTHHGRLMYYRVITSDFIGWIRASSLTRIVKRDSESMSR